MVGKELKALTIDEMSSGDVPEVAGIESGSFTTPWTEQLFYNELHKPGSLTKVAKIGQKVIGYVCAGSVIDEGHILDLAVHPDFRRLGIASSLIRCILNGLRESGCRRVFLEVRASNEAAKKFYEKFNFSVIGLRKKYYSNPEEDAVIMTLDLSG